jgi:N-acetylmuramic acid 6-phosphate etherase
MSVDLKKIGTEYRNQKTMNIDKMSTLEIVKTINDEDKTVAFAVEKATEQIAKLVDEIAKKLEDGGRLIYLGAGTSGRIGIMDAVECGPTFSVPDDMVQCLMAGGTKAMVKAVEGAEDSQALAVKDLQTIHLTNKDVVVGITASGRTPYAIGGITYALEVGASTGCITTSPHSEIAKLVAFPIEAITGAEPITGSTRMKSGTAQKMICNILTTASMIKLGKVYENLMIDVQATNEKLVKRAQSIIKDATGVNDEEASKALKTYKTPKKAVFAILSKITDEEKIEMYLQNAKGNLRKALEEVK